MADKTLFEKIIAREIPAKIAFEDDRALAFYDIAPQAPVHILVVPKKPIPRIGEAVPADETVLGHLLLVAARLGNELDGGNGFRLVINNGKNGGEAVPHLHVHLLAGRPMAWPPG